jgi:hypothetical protein
VVTKDIKGPARSSGMNRNEHERSGRIPPYPTLRQRHRVGGRDVNLVENMD